MKHAWILAGMIALVLSGCKQAAEPEGTLFVSGRIDGDSVDVSSKMAGRIHELTVREGDSVKADQILAKLDSPQQEAIRDTQKARIVSDQRRLEQLQRQLPTYEERIKQSQIYESQAEADAPAQVAHAEATLAASRSDLVALGRGNAADPGRCATICSLGKDRRGFGAGSRTIPDSRKDRPGLY